MSDPPPGFAWYPHLRSLTYKEYLKTNVLTKWYTLSFLCNNFQVIFSGRSVVIAMKQKAEERHIAILHSTEIPH